MSQRVQLSLGEARAPGTHGLKQHRECQRVTGRGLEHYRERQLGPTTRWPEHMLVRVCLSSCENIWQILPDRMSEDMPVIAS